MTIFKIKNRREAKKPKNPLAEKSRLEWLPFIIVVAIFLNLFLTWRNRFSIQSLKRQQPYIYVQESNSGTVSKAKPVAPLTRSESIVSTFAEDWLSVAYSWDIQDPSLFVNATTENVNYPLPLYASSFALMPGYQNTYLISAAIKYKNKFPFASYIAGKTQSKVRIFDYPIIKQLKKGVWEVTIIAHRTHLEKGKPLAEEKFNHKITVRAIKPSNKRLKFNKNNFLTEVMNDMQDKGLQIIKIEQF